VAWDDSVRVVAMTADADRGRAQVDLLVSGPNEPRPSWQLVTEIQRRYKGAVDLRLEYQRNDLFTVSAR
jgi:hypothetical protein